MTLRQSRLARCAGLTCSNGSYRTTRGTGRFPLTALALLVAAALLAAPASGAAAAARQKKDQAVAAIERHRAELTDLSDRIWSYAETALRETRSSAALADYAQQQGFTVMRGVADMPTAFTAEYGLGLPIIGILGEFDALPGISQKAVSHQEALEPNAAGHGCGHNLFGAGSLGAALAVKELMAAGKLKGTIRFYGTPAEEQIGGKLYMLRAGLFSDLDVCLAWHPDSETKADTRSSQALVDFVVEFHGRAAHAAFDPWNGRSAQDGLEIFTFSLNMLREHVKPTVRMHYVMLEGARVPNVVPDYAKLWVWVRDSTREGVEDVMGRMRDIARGAALAAGVQSELKVQGGDYEMLVNLTGAKLIHANLAWLGPVQWTPQEQEFAKEIQRATGVEPSGLSCVIEPLDLAPGEPEGGSTDVGDVSWNVPTLHLSVTTAAKEAPWHAWPVVACGGMSIGHAGMLYAAKALAVTIVDLFEDAHVREQIRAEFAEKTKGMTYKGYLSDGPPPVPTAIVSSPAGNP
jgi:aminobenzoyl-glutamate utilization protein B